MNDQKFTELVEIFKRLRDPEKGCPWDIKQTHESLVQYLIEESYELKDAIQNHPEKIQEELGDLLLQVMLHSQIADDQGRFSVYGVITTLSEKLIERHPHVFGELVVTDAEEVKKNWDKIKTEKNKTSRLAGIPKSAPALFQAELIGKKVAAANFDWNEISEIKAKIKEELIEFLDSKEGSAHEAEEFGDLLFTLAQYSRKLNLSAEDCLVDACNKFTKRFQAMEVMAGQDLSELAKADLEKLWSKVKLADCGK